MKLWLLITINSEYHILLIYKLIQAAEAGLVLTALPARYYCQTPTSTRLAKTSEVFTPQLGCDPSVTHGSSNRTLKR